LQDAATESIEARTRSLQASYAAIAAERIETVPFHDAHGLRAFYATPSRMHDAIRREVHFAHQEQAVTILIICETGHRSPPCDHKFNAVGLGFTLTYSIDHLNDWRAIQDGVTALVAGFIEDVP